MKKQLHISGDLGKFGVLHDFSSQCRPGDSVAAAIQRRFCWHGVEIGNAGRDAEGRDLYNVRGYDPKSERFVDQLHIYASVRL